VVYHIKATIGFIDHWLERVMVDLGMECELCVILYHALLGLEVTDCIYKVLVQKFIGVRKKQARSQSRMTEQEVSLIKKSMLSIEEKNKKTVDLSKTVKSKKYIRFSRMSMCSPFGLKMAEVRIN
jgi:hypothetical protein